MTSLLSALPRFGFTSGTRTRLTPQVSETEYQSVFAATAVLLAGGAALCLIGLTQAF